MSDERRPRTTTDSGIPATSDEFSLTPGPQGPIALHDHYVVQKMQHFNRERVPERVVHAKGGGAHGFFEVTEDVTQFTKADFLSEVGKQTELFLRFSTVAGEQGFPDTVRDPRGFAMKLYTDEGNFDMVGNNTPVFFVRDPSKFQDFIHSQKRLPDTGMHSHDMQWDFWTLSPESAHQVTILMSDRGIPKTWRHQHGFSSHTYSWVNAGGERFWVKYHFRTDQGIENLPEPEADRLKGEDPDFHRRDLIAAIDAGAEDVSRDEDVYEVITEPAALADVRSVLEDAGVELESAELRMRPTMRTPVDESNLGTLVRLIEGLEEHDDVNTVHSNFEAAAELLERAAAG